RPNMQGVVCDPSRDHSPFQLWFVSGFLAFFFSSRRRHTRSYGDWSSDVCSSDLAADQRNVAADEARAAATTLIGRGAVLSGGARSEERRVGKECRSRGSPQH